MGLIKQPHGKKAKPGERKKGKRAEKFARKCQNSLRKKPSQSRG
jgi:hypothetical protein